MFHNNDNAPEDESGSSDHLPVDEWIKLIEQPIMPWEDYNLGVELAGNVQFLDDQSSAPETTTSLPETTTSAPDTTTSTDTNTSTTTTTPITTSSSEPLAPQPVAPRHMDKPEKNKHRRSQKNKDQNVLRRREKWLKQNGHTRENGTALHYALECKRVVWELQKNASNGVPEDLGVSKEEMAKRSRGKGAPAAESSSSQ